MDIQNLTALLGQNATIVGVARDAAAGAVVLLQDRTPVYIAGLSRWEDSFSGNSVQVTGLLQHKHLVPEPAVNAKGEVSHGLAGASYVLTSASWALVKS